MEEDSKIALALLQERTERALVQAGVNKEDIAEIRAEFTTFRLALKDKQGVSEVQSEGKYHTLKTVTAITWSLLSLIIAGLIGIALKVMGG